MKDQFIKILNEEDTTEILPFLLSLTEKERKELVPIIKKEMKGRSMWQNRSDKKSSLIRQSLFVCYSATDVKHLQWFDMPNLNETRTILPSFCPNWFSDYMNSHSNSLGLWGGYIQLLGWQEMGYITPSVELIVAGLPGSLQVQAKDEAGKWKWIYSTDILDKYPIVLDKHIWYLFEYPSNINWADKMQREEERKEEGNWGLIFLTYSISGQLDRMRILRESLLTANRNFNKTQTGWFTDLFLLMEPTTNELVVLQDELLATLSCVQSKPVNTTLTILKKICLHKEFKTDEFLSYLPVLFSSDKKSILSTTLNILDSILNECSDRAEEICILLPAIFLLKDESIQKKAATIITKYTSANENIKNAISPFAQNILMSVQPLLKEYLETNDSPQNTDNDSEELIHQPALIRDDNRIEPINSVEDFAFFLSRAIDLNEGYHFDFLVNTLVQWGNEINEDQLILLEPVFQKTYKSLSENWNPAQLDNIPHTLLIKYGDYLQKKYPGKLTKINKLREKQEEIDQKRSQDSKHYKKRIVSFPDLQINFYNKGFHEIAIAALERIEKQNSLPLLSTPTHLPAWIDPIVLVNRLIEYRNGTEKIIDMDMQLSLQRCVLDDTQQALQLAKEKLTGEIKDMMIFFLGESATIKKGKLENPAWWITAAVTRYPETDFPELENLKINQIPLRYLSGNHQWEAGMKEYLAYGKYNLETKKFDRYPDHRPSIHLTSPEFEPEEDKVCLFYEYIFGKIRHESTHFLLLSCPNIPDNIYGYATTQLMLWSGGWEVREKTIATNIINIMQQLNTPFREMHYYFLGNALLAGDKTVRNYALQIWIDRVFSNTIDSARLGKAAGKIEFLEISPLKRLTDSINESLLGISQQHNQELQTLIEALLCELNEKPIKNLKQLLEIYSELLAINKSQTSIEKIPLFKLWLKNSGLKKIITQILK